MKLAYTENNTVYYTFEFVKNKVYDVKADRYIYDNGKYIAV